MKLETQVLEALARLNSSEPKLIEWLQSRLVQHTSMMVSQPDDVVVRWSQGRAQELSEIIKVIQTAGDVLRKADK